MTIHLRTTVNFAKTTILEEGEGGISIGEQGFKTWLFYSQTALTFEIGKFAEYCSGKLSILLFVLSSFCRSCSHSEHKKYETCLNWIKLQYLVWNKILQCDKNVLFVADIFAQWFCCSRCEFEKGKDEERGKEEKNTNTAGLMLSTRKLMLITT